jgi:exonuclease III
MIHVHNIAAWNTNGLIQVIKEVEVFLNTQKTDILLVSETHFTEQNYVILQTTSHMLQIIRMGEPMQVQP